MLRRFEYTDAKSNKFWEISVVGKKVTVRYGRIGTEGQVQVKNYDSPAEAKRAAEKQIAEKVKKGYSEIGTETAKISTARKSARKPESVSDDAVPELIEDRERMQTVVLAGAFRSAIPPKMLKMIEQENDHVFLKGPALYVGYDLDASAMYGTPFGKTEDQRMGFITDFEEVFCSLAPFMKTEFLIYYFTYTGEYTATMWAYRKGALYTAGGWIGDFCRSRSEEAKNDFVDRHHLPLKSGEIEYELSEAMEKALRRIGK
jgi:predicted DNA-binding WGR domain protein